MALTTTPTQMVAPTTTLDKANPLTLLLAVEAMAAASRVVNE